MHLLNATNAVGGVSGVQITETLPIPLDYKLILQAIIALAALLNTYLINRKSKKQNHGKSTNGRSGEPHSG